MMNLVEVWPVYPDRPMTYQCTECSGRFQDDRTVIYADLNGPAFKAYYCGNCVSNNDELNLVKMEIG